MNFPDALAAIRHAAYRAFSSGQPWGVYFIGQYIAAPIGRLSSDDLLEVCHP